MRYLFILDPLPDLRIHKDTSYAMMREVTQRGHTLFVTEPQHLYAQQGQIQATVQILHFTLTQENQGWYTLDATQDIALHTFDAVIMRKDPPFDMQYLYAAHLLAQAAREGARVFNSGEALSLFNEKLAILRFPEFTAPTLVTQRHDLIKGFLSIHHDIIVKPLDAMGGSGIFRLKIHDPNVNAVLETLTHYQNRSIMVQRYIPEIAKGDKRILLIDGKPVDWCLARIPKIGETRGNLAAGGTGVAYPLSTKDRQIAESVGIHLKDKGLLLAGLDVIGDYLTEINVTSPTCFQEITAQSGINVAALFIDAVEKKCV